MPNDVPYLEEESTYVHVYGSIMKAERRIFASAMHDKRAFIDTFEKMIVAIHEEEHVIHSMNTDTAYSLSAGKLRQIWVIGIPAVK
jgi:hypothetical protein